MCSSDLMIFMNNKTELEKVKAEIESKKEEKEKYEKQLSQLKNQEKKFGSRRARRTAGGRCPARWWQVAWPRHGRRGLRRIIAGPWRKEFRILP